jgi:SAM-dependent methyltransferase
MIGKTALKEDNLNLMNARQREIVLTQWQRHQHEDFEVDYDVSGEKDLLKDFLLKKGVWNPFLASGRYHARYLFYYNELFYGKTAIEIGCGTGLMGVVMAKYGAKKVIMSDISDAAVENTKENVKRFKVGTICSVVQGDLFENIKEKADLITWMIPFFPGTTPKGDTISASMIMPPELFERFLNEAKKFLKKDGVLLIPSFSLGGSLVDPSIVGKKFGYNVKTTWLHNSVNGIQQGMIYMHELRIKG